MNKRKPTLLEQALMEDKRRKLRQFKTEFDAGKPFVEQMARIIPAYTWKEKQKNFINATQFSSWYLGGYKSGKTFTGVNKDIWLSYVNRPLAGILVHPTSDGIELTIMPLIEEICGDNKIEWDYQKLSTKWKVFFKFGTQKKDWGQLILASGDKPKSLKGPKLVWAHIDEPLIMKEEISEVVSTRLAERRGKWNQLLYTGTPEPEHMQWGFDIVDKEEESSVNRFITTMSTREVAEYLAPGYIENQEAMLTPERVATFIDGKYRNISQGKVYHAFDRNENTFEDLKRFKNILKGESEFVLSYDFNVNQMSAVLTEINGNLKLMHEEYRIQARSDTAEFTIMIFQKMLMDGWMKKDGMMKNGRSLIITGDSAGNSGSTKSKQSDYEIIQAICIAKNINYKIYVPPANPSIRDRVNYINSQFQNQSYWINKKCALSIRDRELTSWKLGADGFFVDKSKKELTHLADAADYGIWNTRIISESEGTSGMIMTEGSGRW